MAKKRSTPDMRTIVGVRADWFNLQVGPPGKVKPVRGQIEKDYLTGKRQLNCYAEKNRVIVNCTPLLKGDDGIVGLEPGDPENDQVEVDWYEIELDGKKYRGDAIASSDIEVSNHDANHGLTPRVVFGASLDDKGNVVQGFTGNHKLIFRISVNGFVDETDSALALNG